MKEKIIYKKSFKEANNSTSVAFVNKQKKILKKDGYIFLGYATIYQATYDPKTDETIDSYDKIDDFVVSKDKFDNLAVYSSIEKMVMNILSISGEKFNKNINYSVENSFLVIRQYKAYGETDYITPKDSEWKAALESIDPMSQTLTIVEISKVQQVK